MWRGERDDLQQLIETMGKQNYLRLKSVIIKGYTWRVSDILKCCILIVHIKTLKSTLESDKLSFFSTNGTPVADQPSMHFTLPNKRTPRGGKASSKAPTKLTHQLLLTFFPKARSPPSPLSIGAPKSLKSLGPTSSSPHLPAPVPF